MLMYIIRCDTPSIAGPSTSARGAHEDCACAHLLTIAAIYVSTRIYFTSLLATPTSFLPLLCNEWTDRDPVKRPEVA